MARHRFPASIGRFLRFVALVDVAIIVGIGLVCWFGGWQTTGDYGNGLTYAGLAVMAVGGMRYFGRSMNPDPVAGYHRVDLRDHHTAAQRATSESDSAFGFMLKMGTAGFLALALGQLLRAMLP